MNPTPHTLVEHGDGDYLEATTLLAALLLLPPEERTMEGLHRCRLAVGRLSLGIAYYRAASLTDSGPERKRLENEGVYHFNGAGLYLRLPGADPDGAR